MAGWRLLPLWLLLAACSQQPLRDAAPLPVMPVQTAVTAGQWWRVCFRMPFDELQQPRWAMDNLLAVQVMAPLIVAHQQQIRLWRFHRRAAVDAAGHQFSTWLYSDLATREAIAASLAQHELLQALQAEGLVQRVMVDCGAPDEPENLQAASDGSWDARLQKSWPWFMMGASLHWLALMQEIELQLPPAPGQPQALLAHYQQVNNELVQLWQLQGHHAYFHHLSALFGYRALLMRF